MVVIEKVWKKATNTKRTLIDFSHDNYVEFLCVVVLKNKNVHK